MNRRNFIGGLFAGAAVRTWPFRVYSFPTEIAKPVLVFSSCGGLAREVWYVHGAQLLALRDLGAIHGIRSYISPDDPSPAGYLNLSRAPYPGRLGKYNP